MYLRDDVLPVPKNREPGSRSSRSRQPSVSARWRCTSGSSEPTFFDPEGVASNGPAKGISRQLEHLHTICPWASVADPRTASRAEGIESSDVHGGLRVAGHGRIGRVENEGTRALNRADHRPLYTQIADQIRARIRSKLWPPGYKFPGAEVLSADLGVARGTVRRAMRDLEDEGLVVQVHGRGTFVTAETGTATALPDPGRVSSGERLTREGVYFETRLLERSIDERAPGRGMFSGGQVMRIVRLRRLSEGPDALLHVELALDLVAGAEQLTDMELSAGPLHQTLKVRFGVTAARGERMYSAVAADRRAARLLDVEIGSPLLAFEEFSFDAEDRCYEYTRALVRTDRHPVAVNT